MPYAHVFLLFLNLYILILQKMWFMKRIALLLLAVLVACAPVPNVKDNMAPPSMEPIVKTSEEVTAPAVPSAMPSDAMQEKPVDEMMENVPPAPLENMDYQIVPYTELGCEQLLTKEQFSQVCGVDVSDLDVSYKVGTNNCYVNIKSVSRLGYTSGIALVGYGSGEKANYEFDRRLQVMKAGAFDTIGERFFNFPNPVINSRELYFLRGEFIVKVNADNRLCPSEKVEELARVIDAHIKSS